MTTRRAALALCAAAALAAGVAHAQVSYTGVRGTSTAEGRALDWETLERLHGDLAREVGQMPALERPRADVARILDRNRSFRALSVREMHDLVASHNAIVDALGVGRGYRLRCEVLRAVASRVRQPVCFLSE